MPRSPIAWAKAAIAAQPLTNLAARALPPWVTIFMLHRIEVANVGIRGPSPSYLRQCLSYLTKEGYQFISVEEAINRALNDALEKKKWVAFSLDDGCFEQVEIAAPLFHEFNCPSTCFLIADYVDGKSWPWDYQLQYILAHTKHKRIHAELGGRNFSIDTKPVKAYEQLVQLIRIYSASQTNEAVSQISLAADVITPPRPPKFLAPTSWDQVRHAETLGMQFGPHSCTHRNLAALTDEEVTAEISRSIERINTECALPARVFCYPSGKHGEFDQRAIDALKRADIIGALSAEPGYLSANRVKKGDERFTIPRMAMPRNFDTFKLYISWAQHLREKLA